MISEYKLIHPPFLSFIFICQYCQKCCDQFSNGIHHVTWTVGGDRVLCLWAIDPARSAPFSFLGLCLLNWSTHSLSSAPLSHRSSLWIITPHKKNKKYKPQHFYMHLIMKCRTEEWHHCRDSANITCWSSWNNISKKNFFFKE